MDHFFFEVDLNRQPNQDAIPGVTDEDLKIINSLNKNRPLKTLTKDDIQTRSIIIMGEEPTTKNSIHPDGLLNNRKVNSLTTIARLLPTCPMMVGHRMDKTPWGRTFKAAVIENSPGYKGKVVKEAFWFMNDPEGQAIANKIDGGIWAEGSISYWFKEARCSICHKPMASWSFMGASAKIPRCGHKIGEKDPDTGQICYWYPYAIQNVAETSYVFKGAYTKTRSFINTNKEDLRVAYSDNEISAATELETQLTQCGLDINSLNMENVNEHEENQTGDESGRTQDTQIPPEIGTENLSGQDGAAEDGATEHSSQAQQTEPDTNPTREETHGDAGAQDDKTRHSAEAGSETESESANVDPSSLTDLPGESSQTVEEPNNGENTPDGDQPAEENDQVEGAEGSVTDENNQPGGDTGTSETDTGTADPAVSDANTDQPADNAGDVPGDGGGDELGRGDGKGKGGAPQGDGGASKCVCPKCGYEKKHTKGSPCNKTKCPKCGTALEGKNAANLSDNAANGADENGDRDTNSEERNTTISQDSEGVGDCQADTSEYFAQVGGQLSHDGIDLQVIDVLTSCELDFDEKEASLRDIFSELQPARDDLLNQGLAVLSSMRLSASAVDPGVPEKLQVCSECDETFSLNEVETCSHCGAALIIIDENKASLFRPVGPMKPKKAGATNNEFFKQAAFKDLPDATYFVEPKYDGVWIELHKKGGDIKLYTDEGNEYSAKFPKLVAEAAKLKATNFILAGELTRWRGRQRLTHGDVTAWLHSKQEAYDDKEFKYKPFDMMLFMGADITGDPLDQRRKKMDGILKWGKQIHPTAHRIVKHAKGDKKIINAINDRKTREGAMVKNVASKYLKSDQKLLYKWKQQYELDVEVIKVTPKKGGGWVYACEVGRGQNKKPIGETFGTKIAAKVGDIIQVSVDHVRYNSDEDRYSWFAPKVISLRADKKNPDPLSTVKKMARDSGHVSKSQSVITLTEVIPKLKRADLDVEIFLTGGLVEHGLVTHDIDIITREALTEEQTTAITNALGERLAPYVDITVDPSGPAGPNISILSDMNKNDGKWKYSNKFVLQEHGWGKKVHYDIRFGAPRTKRMWGWTCFTMPSTEAGAKKTRCLEKKYHDAKWMDVDTKHIAPGEPGNPTKKLNAWMKKIDSGTYEYIRRKPKFLEMILHGKKLKGRYVWREVEVKSQSKKTIERHKIDGDEVGTKTDKIWILWKTKDQTPSSPIKKLAYKYYDDCLVYWETDEIDTLLEDAPDVHDQE